MTSTNSKKPSKNVILIGWDGVQREDLYRLLNEGKLPNLDKIIQKGTIVNITITTGETSTKPGWAEILTGYGPEITGVYSNKEYKPVLKGYTIFERLEDYFGEENIITLFISGKDNNVGARGPHKICTNCLTRDKTTREKTTWWEENTSAPTTIPGKDRVFVQREGEPYNLTVDSLDVYLTDLGNASNVGAVAINYLEGYKNQRFFAFLHFEEPDELGHKYGENSEQYAQGIINEDYWLGKFMAKLEELGIDKDTAVYVVSDHGFDKSQLTHHDAPSTFFAANSQKLMGNGDRKDITPTILDAYGFDLTAIKPELDGKTLIG